MKGMIPRTLFPFPLSLPLESLTFIPLSPLTDRSPYRPALHKPALHT